MRKDELFHLHALLQQVASRLVNDGVLAESDLDPYRDLDVTPMTPQGARDDHERAVRTLAAVAAAAVDESGDRAAPDADAPTR